MSKINKEYLLDNFKIDTLGRFMINNNELLEKINGAIDHNNIQIAGWDLSCDNLCGCNTTCWCNHTCNTGCPPGPPNTGCTNGNC